MNRRSHVHAQASKRRGILPQFEKLEDRLALSCSSAIVDNVLTIEGDRGDNQIDVVIQGKAKSYSADIVCDGKQLNSSDFRQPFNFVVIDGNGGNDNINVNVLDVAVTGRAVFGLNVQGGAGADHITVSEKGITANRGGNISIEVEGGRGNDVLVNSTEDIEVGRGGSITIDIEGGKQDDSISLTLQRPDSVQAQNRVSQGGLLGIHAGGGDGNDKMQIDLGDIDIAGMATVAIEMGKGDDVSDININGIFVERTGSLMSQFESGDGDDMTNVTATNLNVAGMVQTTMEGGKGDDAFSLFVDDLIAHENATIKTVIEGGRGIDTIKVDFGKNLKIDPAAIIGTDIRE